MKSKKSKTILELKESLFGCRSFIVKETKDLRVEVISWHDKARITISINCPYTMSFMIDLNKEDVNKFIELLCNSEKEIL